LEQSTIVTTCSQHVQEPIDLVAPEEGRRTGGISLAVAVSFLLHGSFVAWFILSYKPLPKPAANVPMTRYVELMKQNPSQFTEAPGRKVETAPMNAPLSDANRKAAMPEPTGERPTQKPGDGRGLYQPAPNPAPRGPQPSRSAPQMAAAPQQQPSQSATDAAPQIADTDRLVYREPNKASAAAGTIDWNSAIREVGKVATLGGGDGIDLGSLGGGEQGTAEQGPLSFETEWFDWGEYRQSMVSRIRVNWYANMPQIIRTGVQGVVTIRFTIHRDGRISDVTVLKSSGVPPYDFAAEKAIKLSSPLKPLPANFPNPTERVTAMFYYNRQID
jgi:periplasmic protein TonB